MLRSVLTKKSMNSFVVNPSIVITRNVPRSISFLAVRVDVTCNHWPISLVATASRRAYWIWLPFIYSSLKLTHCSSSACFYFFWQKLLHSPDVMFQFLIIIFRHLVAHREKNIQECYCKMKGLYENRTSDIFRQSGSLNSHLDWQHSLLERFTFNLNICDRLNSSYQSLFELF